MLKRRIKTGTPAKLTEPFLCIRHTLAEVRRSLRTGQLPAGITHLKTDVIPFSRNVSYVCTAVEDGRGLVGKIFDDIFTHHVVDYDTQLEVVDLARIVLGQSKFMATVCATCSDAELMSVIGDNRDNIPSSEGYTDREILEMMRAAGDAADAGPPPGKF